MGENDGHPPLPQPGWYTDPGAPHQVRWWDGKAWTEHTSVHSPASATPTSNPARAPKRRPVWPWVVGALVGAPILLAIFATAALSIAGGSVDSVDSTPNAPAAEGQPQQTEPPAPELSRTEQIDQLMAEQGFSSAVAGDIYYRALDPSEFTCGSFDCLYYAIYTVDGCASGIYVAASIETEGGVSVGQSNDITAGLPPEGQAVVELTDYTGNGSGFRLTEMHCMGG